MELLTGLAPLALLLIAVAWMVSRGMRQGPHDRDTSGGFDSHGGD